MADFHSLILLVGVVVSEAPDSVGLASEVEADSEAADSSLECECVSLLLIFLKMKKASRNSKQLSSNSSLSQTPTNGMQTPSAL